MRPSQLAIGPQLSMSRNSVQPGPIRSPGADVYVRCKVRYVIICPLLFRPTINWQPASWNNNNDEFIAKSSIIKYLFNGSISFLQSFFLAESHLPHLLKVKYTKFNESRNKIFDFCKNQILATRLASAMRLPGRPPATDTSLYNRKYTAIIYYHSFWYAYYLIFQLIRDEWHLSVIIPTRT